MNMTRIFWGATSVLMLFALVAVTPAISSATADVTVDALLASSDIVLSEAAMEGVAVNLVPEPSGVIGGAPGNGNGNGNGGGPPFTPPGQGGTAPGQGGTPPGQGGTPPGQGGGGQVVPLITNGEFTTDLTGWTAINAIGGVTSFGSITPAVGSVDGAFAVAHTGPWDASAYGMIEQNFTVAVATTNTFNVLYNFVSTEWASEQMGSGSGPEFNDQSTIVLISNADGTATFSLGEAVNTSAHVPVTGLPSYINDGRTQNGYQTGWLVGSSGPLYFAPGNYTVRIEVMDAGDSWADSAILVDRVGLD